MKKKEMTNAEISAAKKRLTSLEGQLTKTVPLMRRSIVSNGAKHPQPYFSLNKDKRTHLIYLGDGRLARTRSDNYKVAIPKNFDKCTRFIGFRGPVHGFQDENRGAG